MHIGGLPAALGELEDDDTIFGNERHHTVWQTAEVTKVKLVTKVRFVHTVTNCMTSWS